MYVGGGGVVTSAKVVLVKEGSRKGRLRPPLPPIGKHSQCTELRGHRAEVTGACDKKGDSRRNPFCRGCRSGRWNFSSAIATLLDEMYRLCGLMDQGNSERQSVLTTKR